MNRVYRLVFNRVLGQVQVASEIASTAHARGGALGSAARVRLAPLALALLFGPGVQAATLPTDFALVSGSVDAPVITGTTMTINQASSKALINWTDFSIGGGYHVEFVQASGPSAVTLNVVTGGMFSQIDGSLSANGQIFLINPNGILFAYTAIVNVGGLVASAVPLASDNGAQYVFSGSSPNMVVNQGELRASNGSVSLLGAAVVNSGYIGAQGINLLAGSGATFVYEPGAGMFTAAVTGATGAAPTTAGVQNTSTGTLSANAVSLRAAVTPGIADTVVNNAGIINAGAVSGDGSLVIQATGGGVVQSGDVTADTAAVATTGAYTQAGGNLSVGNLHLDTQGSVSLASAGNGISAVQGSVGGDLALTNATALAQAGSLTVAGSSTINTGANAITLNNGGNLFGGTVSVTGGATSITSDGVLRLGSVNATSLTASAGTVSLGANITTAAAQTYIGAVVLDGDAALASTGGGDVFFNGTIDGAHALSVSTGGTTGFNGDVGGIAALSSLTTDTAGNTWLAGDVAASGPISFGDAVMLAGDARVASPGGDVTFGGTIDGSHALAIDTTGTTRFGGNVGGIAALSSLTTDAGGSTWLAGDVAASGPISFGDAVMLAGDARVASSSGDITFGDTIDGDRALAVRTTGTTRFGGAVGGIQALSALDADVGGSTRISGNITTTGATTIMDAAVIDQDAALSGSAIVFGSTVDDATPGSHALSIHATGAVALGGGIGTSNMLAGLTVAADSLYASTISVGNLWLDTRASLVQTAGSYLVSGNALFASDGDIVLTNVANYFGGAVDLTGHSATIAGLTGLTLGTLALNGNLTATSLGSLDLGSGSIAGNLSATGSGVSQSGALAVGGTSAIDANGGAITLTHAGNDFAGAVALAGGSAAIADANALTLGTLALGSLAATSHGALNLGGGSIAGNLAASSNGGGIGQSGALAVGGSSAIDAAGGAISLTDAGNDFVGTVAANGGMLALADANSLALGTVAGDSLSVAAGGALLLGSPQVDALTVNAGGAITAGAIAVDVFTLAGGQWSQLGNTLPSFHAGDFRIAGGTFLRALGGDGSTANPWRITDAYGLQGMGTLLSGHFVLANDIDGSGTAGWNCDAGGANCAGFDPIGRSGAFTGSLDGHDHAIAGLAINRSGEDYVGLFGRLNGTVQDLHLTGGGMVAHANGGAVAGIAEAGALLHRVDSSTPVSGTGNIGGVVGNNDGGTLDAVQVSAAVTGYDGANASNVGGLVGLNAGVIVRSSASGDVDTGGQGYVGGLAGVNAAGGVIHDSYATGNVDSSGEIIGGLVGDNRGGSIYNAYATGNVAGGRNVGGLVGRNINGGQISDVYAGGDVGGNLSNAFFLHGNMGGLVGDNYGGITRAYSIGHVDGNGFVGVSGMIGLAEGGSLGYGYFDADRAGVATDGNGGVALTTAQTLQQSSFAGFDFDNGGIWRIYEGYTTPLLRSFLTAVTLTPAQLADRVYDGTNTGSSSYSSSQSLDATLLLGALGYTTSSRNVGSYTSAGGTLAFGGLYSTQQGYDISYDLAGSGLAITPAQLLLAAAAIGKTYDGTTDSDGIVSATGLVGGDSISGLSQSYDSRNAGNRIVSVDAGYTLEDGNGGGNYAVSYQSATASIDPKAITAAITAADKVYDGTTAATTGGSLAGVIAGDDLALATDGHFADKNAGVGKTVHVTGTLSGADAGNYVLAGNATTTAAIDPKTLTAAIAAAGKIYDGTTDAETDGTLDGVVIGDDVVLATDGHFSDKNAGAGKTVHVTGVLSGADAGNYTLTGNATTTATVSPAMLLVGAADAAKPWGVEGVLGDYTVRGLFAGDAVDSVVLASDGQPAHALPGLYDITASAAQGTGLDNYTIGYRPGRLTVLGNAGLIATAAAAINVSVASDRPLMSPAAGTGATQVVAGGLHLPAACPPDDHRLQCVQRMPD